MALCIDCNKEMTDKIISLEFNGKIVDGVKASVCESCGETYISFDEAKRIEKVVRGNG